MRILRARELRAAGPAGPDWLRGPDQDRHLDVAVVRFEPGAATPLHVHLGGQVLVAQSGTGFVQVDGVVTELHPGDVVVTPPGQWHVHGAMNGRSFCHLSVTTGEHRLS